MYAGAACSAVALAFFAEAYAGACSRINTTDRDSQTGQRASLGGGESRATALDQFAASFLGVVSIVAGPMMLGRTTRKCEVVSRLPLIIAWPDDRIDPRTVVRDVVTKPRSISFEKSGLARYPVDDFWAEAFCVHIYERTFSTPRVMSKIR